MSDLTFVTGNADKFAAASQTCAQYGLTVVQSSLDIDEIQSEDSSYIARKKAEAAFSKLHRPIVITDDSWSIPALRGFPGPYMKFVNQWLTVDDFLRLLAPCDDRSITLTQYLVYQDETGQRVFSHTVPGKLATVPAGTSDVTAEMLVQLEGDAGRTVAETKNAALDKSKRGSAVVWHDLIKWYQENRI